MSHRTRRSYTDSNNETFLSTHPLLDKLFQRRRSHHFISSTTLPSSLYIACQNNDLAGVESCVKKMKRKEIDRQYSPNEETALHVATRNQHKEIIKILLFYGAQRSLRNTDGHQAYELAETQEIKDLFKRPPSSRFVFLHGLHQTATSLKHKIECKSCSLINDDTFYEWELIDQNAPQKALRFRHELKPSTSMKEKDLKKKLYSTRKGYLNVRLQDISESDGTKIHDYFNRAQQQQKPCYIITAYTICQKFSKLLNTDMARNVIHDLKNGCSKFCCDCLYSTEDGIKTITSIFLHHPDFQKLNFKGEVYRGIVAPKNILSHYKVDCYIITTTFLSTSIYPEVAHTFSDRGMSNQATHSFFCTYEIINDNRTALDISTISEFPGENEVLILPYSAFLITKIEEGEEKTNIYLREQCLPQAFGMKISEEYSMKSPTQLMELFKSNLLHNTSEPLPHESEYTRPRSVTSPH